MVDKFSKTKRSEIMKKIASSGNKSTEERMIGYFKKYKIKGWRRNYSLYGKPDFVFPKLRLALFIDGCFWHGHNCRNLIPSTNTEYWQNKILKNKNRDAEVTKILIKKHWKVIRIWECQIKKDLDPEYIKIFLNQ